MGRKQRLEKLEMSIGDGGEQSVRVIFICGGGEANPPIGAAMFVGSRALSYSDFDDADDFKAAVDAKCKVVIGRKHEWRGDERFCKFRGANLRATFQPGPSGTPFGVS